MTRRTTAAIAAVTIAGLATPAVVQAVDATHEIKVTATPRKAGTKAKPKGTKLKVTLLTTPGPNAQPFATSAAIVAFDKNLVFGTSNFPSCTKRTVENNPANCPTAAKVGSGSAVGRALGQVQNLTVTAYNGPGGTIQLLVRGSSPLQINSVIEGKLKNASGQFGKRLVVSIPQNLQQPVQGVFATLTDFTVTIQNKSRGGKPYIGIKGCSNRRLNFRSDLTYTDGTSKTARDSITCAK